MHLSHLVVVIPGIGGSVLRDPASGEVVWSQGLPTLLSAIRRPEVLDLDRPLEAVGLLQDIQAVPGWTVVPGYSTLWNTLSFLPGAVADRGNPRDRDYRANVLAFPYDFRRSIREAAADLGRRVDEQLRALGRAGEPDSVIVIAHSMGGLVARYWIAQLGGASVCRAVMTLGTPHRGAPKALDVWAHGASLQVGGMRKVFKKLSAETRRWPSLAELLPRYPCIADPDNPGRGLHVHDLARVSPTWAGLAAAGAHGWAVHQEIEFGWVGLERAPRVRPRVGFGQPTLQSARLEGGRLTVSELAPLWCNLGAQVLDAGDGTVPSISGFPLEFEDSPAHDPSLYQVPVSHGRIGNDQSAAGFIGVLEGWTQRTGARGSQRRVGLGLGAADLNAAGSPIPVRITWTGVEDEVAAKHRVFVRATSIGHGQPIDAPMNVEAVWDSELREHVVHVSGLGEGWWTLTASARAVPAAGDLEATKDITVLDVTEVDL